MSHTKHNGTQSIWKVVSDKESGVTEDREHRRAKIKSWKTLEGNYFHTGTLLRV